MTDLDKTRHEKLITLRNEKLRITEYINKLVEECPHNDLDITSYGTATCKVCNKELCWYCPTSPTKACEYRIDVEDLDIDYSTMSKQELYTLCKDRDIECSDEDDKLELEEMLEDYDYDACNDECCIHCHQPQERK